MTGDPLARTEVTPYFKTTQTERPAGAPKKKARTKASPKRWREIRAKKCGYCRTCGYVGGGNDGRGIHAHHLLKKGAPWFGQDTENNIVGLCGDCHHELHTMNTERIRKILRVRLTLSEVAYADEHAYPGYFDDVLWRIRPAQVPDCPHGLPIYQPCRDCGDDEPAAVSPSLHTHQGSAQKEHLGAGGGSHGSG